MDALFLPHGRVLVHALEPQKPPFLLLHGFLGVAEHWRPVANALPHAWCLDLPGHHPSTPPPGDWSEALDHLGHRIRLLRKTYQLSPLTLVGYSLGGRLSLGLALRFPEHFARVVLLSTHPGLTDAERPARADADARWADLLAHQPLATFLEQWETQPIFAHRDKRGILPYQLGHDPNALLATYQATGLAKMPSYWDQLNTLPHPVWAAGKKDVKFTELAQKVIHNNNATFWSFETGHDIPSEAPEMLASRLLSL